MQTFTKKHCFYALCLLLAPSVLHSDVVIERISKGNLKKEKAFFVKEFDSYYRKLNTTIEDEALQLPEVTDADFEDEEKDFKELKSETYFFRAMLEEHLVGYVSFEKTNKEHEVYIRQLVVDVSFERKGIGKALGFDTVFKSLPDTKHVVIITRRSNHKALQFYQKLGFKECSYMHEGYSAEKFIGLEFLKKTNLS